MDSPYQVTALSPIRKVIAARMTEACQTILLFRLMADLEADAINAMLSRLRTQYPDAKVSLNNLLLKACALAMIEVPARNVQFAEKEIRCLQNAYIGIIVAIEGGIATPVLRNVETKSILSISREVNGLAARAQNG
jgi:pyruvate dehydrogenase E2 component (dihydrolipoamide acetyltransferase)